MLSPWRRCEKTSAAALAACLQNLLSGHFWVICLLNQVRLCWFSGEVWRTGTTPGDTQGCASKYSFFFFCSKQSLRSEILLDSFRHSSTCPLGSAKQTLLLLVSRKPSLWRSCLGHEGDPPALGGCKQRAQMCCFSGDLLHNELRIAAVQEGKNPDGHQI